jgi:hypothetical protein
MRELGDVAAQSDEQAPINNATGVNVPSRAANSRRGRKVIVSPMTATR